MADLRSECKEILSAHLGRKLTPKESASILPGIRAHMARLRQEEPDLWSVMTKDERVAAAADRLANNLREQARAVRRRSYLQAVQAEKLQKIYRNNAEQGLYGKRSVAKILSDTYRYTKGVQQQYFSRISKQLSEALPGRFGGYMEDAKSAYALVQELMGEESQNAEAKKVAAVVSKTFSDLRTRFNRAGGDIGELLDWALPQSHDANRVAAAARRLSKNRLDLVRSFTPAQNREAWVDFIMPLVDRQRYLDDEGNLLSDDQMREFLGECWRTISTQGTGDDFGSRVAGARRATRANRYSQHRAIHFKDAQSYITYEQKFGTGSVMSTIVGRVRSMSKDIALLESLGPNPTTSFEMLDRIADADLKNATSNESTADRGWKYRDINGSLGVKVRDMWNVLNGNADIPAGTGVFASFMQGARNLQVAGKLGSAFISSFSDIPSYWIAMATNRMNPFTAPFGLIRWLSKRDREFATRAGILADTVSSGLCRWYDDNVGNGITAILADTTIRLSLLEAWTNGIRRAFGLNYMAAAGKLVATKEWGGLDAYDRSRFERHGITESDWRLLRMARPEDYKGCKMLTRQSLEAIDPARLQAAGFTTGYRDQVASKYLAMLTDEMHMASIEPDLATRTAASRGYQRGTIDGELARSIMLFKSFPFAVLTRHFERMNSIGRGVQAQTGSRAFGLAARSGYAAGVIVATTCFGALSLQAANILAGRDMQDVQQWEFWGNAMVKGGGLGILGDMIYNGVFTEGAYGAPNVINFLGPIAGSAFDTWDIGAGLVGSALYDRETKVGAKVLRLVRGNTPFMNLWYVKGALDHAVFNDLNEMLSPGYLRRQRDRAKRTQGQEYWWRQDELFPRRLPRMADVPNR